MRILDYMERLQTLTRLLKKEHTGSAAKIAKEMGVHRNTIINYFILKDGKDTCFGADGF